MIDLVLVGIGTGNPEHLTLEASRQIREADLILVPLKGGERASLAAIRKRIIANETADDPVGIRSDDHASPKVVDFLLPDRDPAIDDYRQRVNQWHSNITSVWETTIREHVALDSPARVILLIWGDPSLYDSSLRIAEQLKERLPITITVIPGITAMQALCAAHAIPLNTLANPVVITTGRKLAKEGWPDGIDTIVVMLDGDCAFRTVTVQNVHIWWGAYVAMKEQILISGPLQTVAEEIADARCRAREEQGWIMDIYLLRRSISSFDPVR
ncbi:MAG: precorrin-6A synthase (deacetylating) [Pseudomonadota bacterium]